MTPNGMGSVVRDLDGDGRPDWLVTGISYPTASGRCPHVDVITGCSGNRVFLNRGGLRFVDATDRFGLRDSGWAWGIAADDFGNDGRTAIAVTNGFVGGNGFPGDQRSVYYDYFDDDPMAFFVPSGRRYVDVARQVGLTDTGVEHALLAFDFDGDGRQDLLVNDGDAGPRLYRNVTPTDGRHWVTVRLDDPGHPGNRSALGARIRVISAGRRVTDGWLTSSTSYETQGPAELHVGLGPDDRPVSVQVWWPGSARPQTYAGIRPDGTRTITR